MNRKLRVNTSERSASDGAETESSRPSDRTAVIASVLVAHHRRRGGGARGSGGSGGSKESGLLNEKELKAIESAHADGMTAVQIVEVFASRGLRFSEATFRKYVQQELVPRSRRVGRKGKNRGSLGVYPARAVRRINAIKRLMDEGFTIEEIREQFLRYTDLIETLEEGLTEVFKRFESEVDSERFDTKMRRTLKRDLAEARKSAGDLMRRIDGLAGHVTSQAREESYRRSGAAGSAEDLL